MSDQQPTPRSNGPEWTTPTWYTPHGGTGTATRPELGSQTAPLPAAPQQQPHAPQNHPTGPSVPPPPHGGPGGPVGASGPPGSPSSGSGRRRVAELSAVALLAAALSTGGTLAAVRLTDDAQTPSTAQSSAQPDPGTEQQGPVAQADANAPDWTATAAAVSPSVVAIDAASNQGEAAGSGVVIDRDGHVVTNNHVVAGAQKLQVTLADGRTYAAEVQGTDPSTDLAVITIENAPQDLAPVTLGDSDALTVGEPVMAVGNPLGLAGTVTTGIVSALNRPVTTQAEQQPSSPFGNGDFQQQQAEPVVTNAIQTSAAINPGNSGGALVDAEGRLVGINSSIASLGGSNGGQSGSIGIGFAIPVREVSSIADQLIKTGTAKHAYLGVTPQDGSASDGSATRAGAEITSVGEGTPAAQAGLQEGDVVVAVDGEAVDSAESLVAHIREKTVGDTVQLTVLRDGRSTELTATLEARDADAG
ncbi:trypsin-like peptidase domain-containing protein [Phycicoccus sp. CSK15P-2]|uniref:S1C family serine protease n=1 Tax=Phycicoccus sp. CSK15P-2 TaxID=2807627 RepID=UPI00194F8EBF|nr:trypsin-like peptidase domain-containing protein [Phycicoccus sp. CSK15P-2]MBM6403244.1 trypsin-like peptidase domain-containing protein [Phycicoccus sp. CSK15P-2]